ncbi:MAG: uracil-DNA glycosylase [Rhodospirillales bacterium]|nr:uracil-DNA glycosylase [Rhodospirillales bacterium]
MTGPMAPRDLLAWYLDAGVDEAIGDRPVNRYAAVARPAPVAEPPPAPDPAPPLPAAARAPSGPVQTAYDLAAAAASVEALGRALESFDDCPLKKTATNLVFCDGSETARLIMIGEAPGAEEDRQGCPFVGPSGQLLDRMLASVGLDRTQVLISNTVFWRPPGNRTPTTAEIAACLPFVERLIELVDPAFLVALGGAAAKTLLARNESVGKLRGKWFPYSTPRLPRPVQATATYHPAYLLRSPAQKRAVWRDLLAIKKKMTGDEPEA